MIYYATKNMWQTFTAGTHWVKVQIDVMWNIHTISKICVRDSERREVPIPGSNRDHMASQTQLKCHQNTNGYLTYLLHFLIRLLTNT